MEKTIYRSRKLRIVIAVVFAITLIFTFTPIDTSHAANRTEVEPNNDINTAQGIDLEGTVTGNLVDDGGDPKWPEALDYYKFTVTTAAPYTVEFSHAAGVSTATFASIDIQDSNGASKEYGYSSINEAKKVVIADYLYPGTYVIRIKGSEGIGQPYSFVLKKGAPVDSTRGSFPTVLIATAKGVKTSKYTYSVYSGTELTDKQYKVSYSSTKVGKRTITIKGVGNYYGSFTKKVTILPATPELNYKKSGSYDGGKVVIAWDKVPKVTNYLIKYKLPGSKKWKSKTLSAKKNSITFKNLKANKKVQFKVTAYAKVGKKKFYSSNGYDTKTKYLEGSVTVW
jgi:hypothetical protein